MRPALKPGLLWVWRDRDTLQIGIDPRRAVALTGMGAAAAVIGLLDGSRDHAQVLQAAAEHGVHPGAADRVITLLAAAGALQDFPAGTLRALPPGARSRLASELATASLAHGDGDGGARVLARRQAASVRVYGTGPVGSCIASLLAASGISRVGCTGVVTPAGDLSPPAAEPAGWPPRAGSDTEPAAPGWPGLAESRPDLAVVVGNRDPGLGSALVRERIPHLAVSAGEAIGVVGPLVIPGQSACLRCLDLARADRDPAWPLILAQLAGRDPLPAACDAALATAVAAQAAGQALTFIDRAAPARAVTNGTLELVLPDWQWRRRTWLQHDDCACSTRSASCRTM